MPTTETRKLSPAGARAIELRESPGGNPPLKAYQDGGGVWTIGHGHTRGVKRGMTCTPEQAHEWLVDDAREAEASIRYFIPAKNLALLPQDAYDALVSFVFNLGRQAFVNPKSGTPTGVQRALNAMRWKDVAIEFQKWVYDNGVKVPGLANRRASEAEQWLKSWPAEAIK